MRVSLGLNVKNMIKDGCLLIKTDCQLKKFRSDLELSSLIKKVWE